MDNSEQHLIDRRLRTAVEKISSVMGRDMHDRCWPLFHMETLAPSGLDMAVANDPVRLRLLSPIKVGVSFDTIEAPVYTPMAFLREGDRDQFLAKTGLDQSPDIAKRNFPTRDELTSGEQPRSGRWFFSNELDMRIQLKGENAERIPLLLRDSDSKAFPNCFTTPGGMGDRSPMTGSIKEMNEEMSFVLKHGGKHYLVLFSYEGETGISITEKLQKAPLIAERVRKTFSVDAETVKAERFETLIVPLQPNPNPPQKQVQGTLAYNGISQQDEQASGTFSVLVAPKINAVCFKRNVTLPAAVKGIPLTSLEFGKNLFIVDSESQSFDRPVYLLTFPELMRARYPTGREDVQEYGAVQDAIAGFYGDQFESFDGPLPPYIVHRGTSMIFRHNRGKGGPYALVQKRGPSGPRLKADMG